MKNSLLTAVSISLFAFACGTTDDVLIPSKPVDQTPAEQPPVAAKRTIVQGNQLPTSPVNLLMDSGFGTVDQQQLVGWFAWLESDFSDVTLTSKLDSRSPVGFAGGVGLVLPTGATDKKSDAVLVLTAFAGGTGPFRAQVWVSKSTVAGKPTDFAADDPKVIKASVTDGTPDGQAFDLALVPEATRKAGDRTWSLLRGVVPQALTFGGYFVVRTGESGGQWQIAAPEVVAQPLVDGIPTRSLTTSLRARPKSSAELRGIAKQQTVKPLMVPASAKTPRL